MRTHMTLNNNSKMKIIVFSTKYHGGTQMRQSTRLNHIGFSVFGHYLQYLTTINPTVSSGSAERAQYLQYFPPN